MAGQERLAGNVWITSQASLESAYSECDAITRFHSKSFYMATSFLPPAKRRAIRALYAFCRSTDDLVDEPDRAHEYSLEGWASYAHSEEPPHNDLVLMAWADTRHTYGLSPTVIDDLIAGMRMDLTISRYKTFEELWLYCYRVASTVGLLSMQVIGSANGAEEYAVKLGVALQLTNILRDVGEDARRGRLYLPLDELEQFGLSEHEVISGCCDERYQSLMKFQIERARRLYEEAWPGIAMLDADGRFAVAAAAAVYRGILTEVERNEYDNHTYRASVSLGRKLALLPGAWLQVRRMRERASPARA